MKPAAIQAAAKPGAKAAAKPATKKAAAKPGAKAAKAVAEAKPLITAGAKATPVAPLMDHPAPADMPGAPFAPPPPGGYAADAGSSDAPGTDSKGHDVVAAAAQAAGGLVQVGLGVAKTILARLPRR
ncbi:MAG: hypothetical protein JWO02_1911 [Solirubrobacterales bacterium]|nr:hypothetical protein [Solirubrobacterales bacterium]